MSVLTKLIGGAATASANPVQDITARLKIAEDELSRLEQEFEQKAVDIVLDGGDIAPINRRLAEARDTVSTMRAALKGAQEREQAELQRKRLAVQKTQIKAVIKSLGERDGAAVELVPLIEKIFHLWKKVVDQSMQARNAGVAVGHAIGVRFPDDGSFCSDKSLYDLLAYEFYRVSGAPPASKEKAYEWPGANAPDLNVVHNPKGITPLDEQIKRASAHLSAMFKTDKSD